LFFLLSCNDSRVRLFTHQPQKIIEADDHPRCVSQSIDSKNQDKIIAETYWLCRYNLVVDRKIFGTADQATIKHNSEVEKISAEFLNNLSRAKYAPSATIDDKIELSDHNRCLASGYNLAIGQSNDNYYRCRQDLIIAHLPPIAQGNKDFNQEISQIIATTDKYPDCVNLNINSMDFKRCVQAADESRECIGNIYSVNIKQELQNKIYCQTQSFIQFPDNYGLAKNKSTKEIEKLMLAKKKAKEDKFNKKPNTTLEYLEGNQNITAHIGRYSPDNSDKEEQLKGELYGRIELLKLRESFIYQCDKNMDNKLPNFVDRSLKYCLDIAKNWDKN